MTDKHSGRMSEWQDAERHEMNLMIARGYKIKHAFETVRDKYQLPDYKIQTVYTYTKCPQGKKEYEEALKQVRAEAKEKTLSHRGSRLDALIEVAEKLMEYFRLSDKPTEMTKLAAEIRSCMTEIRNEVDPYGIEDASVMSHFDKLLGGFSKLQEKKQNMILEDQFWLNSTQQTESN